MQNKIVIVADLGGLKAYALEVVEGINPQKSGAISQTAVLKEMKGLSYITAHQSLQDVVSDSAGRFGQGNGEKHTIEIEREKRGIKEIAKDIDNIIAAENPKSFYLAFPKETNSQLVEALSGSTKQLIKKNVAADLTKVDKSKLLSYF